MSCVLVCLPGAPQPSEEAIQQEEELDSALRQRVPLTNIIKKKKRRSGGPARLLSVLRTLGSEVIPRLPPGGGLASEGVRGGGLPTVVGSNSDSATY
uniref:protein-serine/threonine phosphatase n=1 Tax=Ornithorhynchus anatinus TaxID=9258 RepID=A0A6I8PKL6_ORNAN